MLTVQDIGNQQLYDEILKQMKSKASFFKKMSIRSLTKKDAQECKSLLIEKLELTNLEFLMYFPNLTSLFVSTVVGLQNIDGLRYCSNLVDLDFFNTNIYSLEGVQYCSKLQHLSLFPQKDFDQCMDLSFVKYLPELEDLDIVACNITDITLLAQCKSLIYLDVSNNPLVSIEPLYELPLLKELGLVGCNIGNRIDISRFQAIEAINLEDNLFSKEEQEEIISQYPDIYISF